MDVSRFLSWTDDMRICNWPALLQTHPGAPCGNTETSHRRHHRYYTAEEPSPSRELELLFISCFSDEAPSFSLGIFLYGDGNAVPLLRYTSVCGSWLKAWRERREYPSRSPEWLSEEWLWELATLIRLKNVNDIFMSLTTYGPTLILPKFILYIQIGGWDIAKLLKLYNTQNMCWRNESYCIQSRFPKDTFPITKFLWNA